MSLNGLIVNKSEAMFIFLFLSSFSKLIDYGMQFI